LAKRGVIVEKILQPAQTEIVLGSRDSQVSRAISNAVKTKKLRKIAPRIYTSNMSDNPSAIINRNQYFILGKIFPGAVISHRSALEGGPTKDGVIFLTYHYTKKIHLPGLTIRLLKGEGPVDGDMPFVANLYLASRPRAFLENLQASKQKDKTTKILPRIEIETRLENICRIKGEDELNKLRDDARALAKKLNMQKEFQKLDKIIAAILGTNESHKLISLTAKARKMGVPFDSHRLELFADLSISINAYTLPVRPNYAISDNAKRNIAFFDAYFSNYIEGTKFAIDEAADIVFKHKINIYRPEDSHDILGTFRILSDTSKMKQVPGSADDLLKIIKHRHATLLEGRPDKQPGHLKETSNRAGNTVFVAPELVNGTLIKGFEIYSKLDAGLARAIFIMFLIAEIHPFTDGNGRLARIMMNAELAFANESKIIIPTVYREDYLLTLRNLSRNKNAKPYIKMLLKAQEFTHQIDFNDYEKVLELLTKCNAFQEPGESMLIMPKNV
jgi:hypothetical protein